MELNPHIILGVLWIAYFFIHSFLANLRVKAWIQQRLRGSRQSYRIAYNVISLALLWPILQFQDSFVSPVLFDFPGQRILAAVFALIGLAIMYIAFKNYSTKAFLGLSDPELTEESLATSGLHAYTRHPLYLGAIIFLFGYLFYAARLSALVVVAVAFLYLYVGTVLEEKKLALQYGEAYLQYKKKVRMFIPFVF